MALKQIKFKDLEGLGSRLKLLRERKKLTVEAAAAPFGIAGSTITRWEKGTIEPPLGYLAYWIESGDCDPYWLLFGDG